MTHVDVISKHSRAFQPWNPTASRPLHTPTFTSPGYHNIMSISVNDQMA